MVFELQAIKRLKVFANPVLLQHMPPTGHNDAVQDKREFGLLPKTFVCFETNNDGVYNVTV